MDPIKLCCTTNSTQRWAKGEDCEQWNWKNGTTVAYWMVLCHYHQTRAKAGQVNLWHACPKWHAAYTESHFFFFNLLFSDQSLYVVPSQSLYMNYRCYQLILQVKHFLHKSGAVRSVDWIFIIWGAGLTVTLDKKFELVIHPSHTPHDRVSHTVSLSPGA